MTRDEFQKLMDRHYQFIKGINDTKGDDYAGQDDALRNFKEQAVRLGLTPFKVWGVLADKHWFAIESFVKNGELQSEPIEGRLHDIILYSFLLLGLIEDLDPTGIDAGVPSTGRQIRREEQ